MAFASSGGPDAIAVTRARLQHEGVSFGSAMSATTAELKRAAADEEVFRRMVERLKRLDESRKGK